MRLEGKPVLLLALGGTQPSPAIEGSKGANCGSCRRPCVAGRAPGALTGRVLRCVIDGRGGVLLSPGAGGTGMARSAATALPLKEADIMSKLLARSGRSELRGAGGPQGAPPIGAVARPSESGQDPGAEPAEETAAEPASPADPAEEPGLRFMASMRALAERCCGGVAGDTGAVGTKPLPQPEPAVSTGLIC